MKNPIPACYDCGKVKKPEELKAKVEWGHVVIVCKDGCQPVPEKIGEIYGG